MGVDCEIRERCVSCRYGSDRQARTEQTAEVGWLLRRIALRREEDRDWKELVRALVVGLNRQRQQNTIVDINGN